MSVGKIIGQQSSIISKIFNLNISSVGKVAGQGISFSATGGTITESGGYRIHTFTTLNPTLRFWALGAGNYTNDGWFYIYDSDGDYVGYNFSYTTSEVEVIIDLSKPDVSSGTFNWDSVVSYRFYVNTSGRTVYIDRIRFYDSSNTLTYTNGCQSTSGWSAVNGTVSLSSTGAVVTDSYSICLVSSSASAYASYSASSLSLATPTLEYFVATGSGTVEVLIIGGGGGGAGTSLGGFAYGGGGGAGGYRLVTGIYVTDNSYRVLVGIGGLGSARYSGNANDDGFNGMTGNNSSVFGYISYGGGGGGLYSTKAPEGRVGKPGGSGGGGFTSGSGVSGQGYNGGYGQGNYDDYGPGGGGAGGVGGNGSAEGGTGTRGAGVTSSFSGSSVTYAQGGEGGGSSQGGSTGTAHRGNGGGGGGYTTQDGGNGGSGIVIIRYPI